LAGRQIDKARRFLWRYGLAYALYIASQTRPTTAEPIKAPHSKPRWLIDTFARLSAASAR
jgi:hypothetical protein